MNRALEALMLMTEQQRQTLEMHFQWQILLLNLDVMDLYHHPMNSIHVQQQPPLAKAWCSKNMPTTAVRVKKEMHVPPHSTMSGACIRKQRKMTKKNTPKRIVFHEYK